MFFLEENFFWCVLFIFLCRFRKKFSIRSIDALEFCFVFFIDYMRSKIILKEIIGILKNGFFVVGLD